MQLNSTFLISIISPVYNRENYIQACIDSVLAQSYPNWELILVDDGSSDNSVNIIKLATQKDQRIKLIQHTQNSGVGATRNTGLEAAKGHYIAFLDSDDQWLPAKLEKQLRFMQEHQAVISHTAYAKVDENGQIFADKIEVNPTVNYKALLKHNEIGLSTSMIKRDAFQDIAFDRIPFEDYALWLKLLKQVDYSYGLNEVLTWYRIHKNSVSFNKFISASYTWNIYRKVEKFSLFKAAYYFLCYSWNAGKKYLKRK